MRIMPTRVPSVENLIFINIKLFDTGLLFVRGRKGAVWFAYHFDVVCFVRNTNAISRPTFLAIFFLRVYLGQFW